MQNLPRAVKLTREMVQQSQRTKSVRLPKGFARDQRDLGKEGWVPCPPLSMLMKRKGETSLKLLLTILMRATKAPHGTRVIASEFAAALGFPSSNGEGARRVHHAIKVLEGEKLVKCDRKSGLSPVVTVLDPAGGGSEWSDREIKKSYIGIPIEFWTNGWIHHLNARSIAVFIVLLEATGGRSKSTSRAEVTESETIHLNPQSAWIDGLRKREYGLSPDTWARATRELTDAALLEVKQVKKRANFQVRMRNEYTLHLERLMLTPSHLQELLSCGDTVVDE